MNLLRDAAVHYLLLLFSVLMQMHAVVGHGHRGRLVLHIVLVRSTEPVQHRRRLHDPLDPPTANLRHDWVNELEKVVGVSDADSDQIHDDRVTEQRTEREHDPRQVGCVEMQKSEKDHFDVFIATAPNVGHHKSQCVAQEVNVAVVRSEPRNIDHTEEQHP